MYISRRTYLGPKCPSAMILSKKASAHDSIFLKTFLLFYFGLKPNNYKIKIIFVRSMKSNSLNHFLLNQNFRSKHVLLINFFSTPVRKHLPIHRSLHRHRIQSPQKTHIFMSRISPHSLKRRMNRLLEYFFF